MVNRIELSTCTVEADFKPDFKQLNDIQDALEKTSSGRVLAFEKRSLAHLIFFGKRKKRMIAAWRKGCDNAPVTKIAFPERATTDWDEYYSHPYKSASYSRKLVGRKLFSLIRRYAFDAEILCELGGGASCFADAVMSRNKIKEYHVCDSNPLSTSLLDASRIIAHNADVTESLPVCSADLVFSVGLIEHFDKESTVSAIRAHFANARKAGTVIMLFPFASPTYKITRFCAEKLGIWIFHDERPLDFSEVELECSKHGTILHKSLVRGIFLTQGAIAVRKNDV